MDSLNEVSNKQKISVQSKLPKKTSLDQMPCFYLGGGGREGKPWAELWHEQRKKGKQKEEQNLGRKMKIVKFYRRVESFEKQTYRVFQKR